MPPVFPLGSEKHHYGFDFADSPFEISTVDFDGKAIIQRQHRIRALVGYRGTLGIPLAKE